jgi:putative peptidoglycan binding protein
MGRSASKNETGSLLSLIWIETAAGKSVQNHNYGNISASSAFSGSAWRPTWFEIDESSSERDKSLHRAMLEGKAPSAFRAYDTPEAGMGDFVKQIQRGFPEVLAASDTADPDAFRVALSQKYSKDYSNPNSTKSFASLFRQFGLDPKAVAGEGLPTSSPQLHTSDLPTLRRDSLGSAVSLLGAFFGWRGVRFGIELCERVKTFQGQNGLVPDGIVGPKTWLAITSRMLGDGST